MPYSHASEVSAHEAPLTGGLAGHPLGPLSLAPPSLRSPSDGARSPRTAHYAGVPQAACVVPRRGRDRLGDRPRAAVLRWSCGDATRDPAHRRRARCSLHTLSGVWRFVGPVGDRERVSLAIPRSPGAFHRPRSLHQRWRDVRGDQRMLRRFEGRLRRSLTVVQLQRFEASVLRERRQRHQLSPTPIAASARRSLTATGQSGRSIVVRLVLRRARSEAAAPAAAKG